MKNREPPMNAINRDTSSTSDKRCIPIIKNDPHKLKASMKRLETTINRILKETKLSENELAHFLTKDWEGKASAPSEETQ